MVGLGSALIIRNPAAGRGRAQREWPEIVRRLKGFEFEEVVTSRPGEATSIAKSTNHGIVVACGGDGTVHEVVNGLMLGGAKAALGVIPLGSGDDFAKMIGSFDPAKQKTNAIDIGKITADGEVRYFANGMDIGFGAHGARNVASVPRFLTGLGAYLAALVLTLVRYPLLRVRLQIDDGPAADIATVMTAVMNGSTFGGSFRVCPEARVDDGLLDVLRVDALGRIAILGLVPKIMRGTHAGDPRLELFKTKRVRMESEAPLLVEADGEIAFTAARRLEVELLPRALRVLA